MSLLIISCLFKYVTIYSSAYNYEKTSVSMLGVCAYVFKLCYVNYLFIYLGGS